VAGRAFEYRGDFSVSFAVRLPQTPALSLQNQFQPALKVCFIRDDKPMLARSAVERGAWVASV
jgi:hypothetical protein